MSEQRTGRIVKWVKGVVENKGWGIINSYQAGAMAPDKFFFHISMLKTPGYPTHVGARVAFTPGPPRTERELPTAHDVRLLDVPESGVGEVIS